jgi:ornithine cyclodeaminase
LWQDIHRSDQANAQLEIAPAWTDFTARQSSDFGYLGVSVSAAFPGNAGHDRPDEMGVYVLMSGRTGEPIGIIDGRALRLRRAAATSALAAQYLARADSKRLLVVGAGSLAGNIVAAMTAVRPVNEVLIWARTHRHADATAFRLRNRDYRIAATSELENAVRGADIVVCATSSAEPVISGAWIRPGTHIDLSGAAAPDHRQGDNALMARARVFVDTPQALSRCGDLVAAIQSGDLTPDDVAADLFDLSRGIKSGRRFDEQITVFASAGSAIADLAAAAYIFLRI